MLRKFSEKRFIYSCWGFRESYRHLIWALMKGVGQVGRDRSPAPGGRPSGVWRSEKDMQPASQLEHVRFSNQHWGQNTSVAGFGGSWLQEREIVSEPPLWRLEAPANSLQSLIPAAFSRSLPSLHVIYSDSFCSSPCSCLQLCDNRLQSAL